MTQNEGIPMSRVYAKLDRCFAEKKFDEAERLLHFWLAESTRLGDERSALAIVNEQIGFYRKLGREKDAMRAAADAMARLQAETSVSPSVRATTLINIATAYKAFGNARGALPLYEQAQEIYEAVLSPSDARLGALYNNMALALVDLGSFSRAQACYERALALMLSIPGGEPEAAITYCNLADLVAAERGMLEGEAKINEYLERAMALLDTKDLAWDGNYAFVCEKCAPTFGHYGFFLNEMNLAERAKRIYERA